MSEKRFLEAPEVAAELGVSLSQAYRLMRTEIPRARFGKSLRVERCDLEQYIRSQKEGAHGETQSRGGQRL